MARRDRRSGTNMARGGSARAAHVAEVAPQRRGAQAVTASRGRRLSHPGGPRVGGPPSRARSSVTSLFRRTGYGQESRALTAETPNAPPATITSRMSSAVQPLPVCAMPAGRVYADAHAGGRIEAQRAGRRELVAGRVDPTDGGRGDRCVHPSRCGQGFSTVRPRG